MIQVAKIIGADLTTIGFAGAGIEIGVVFGALILGVARNPSLRVPLLLISFIRQTFSLFLPILALLYLSLSGNNNNGPTREELE
jgi:F-type H+-transporting ATPase subunit c